VGEAAFGTNGVNRYVGINVKGPSDGPYIDREIFQKPFMWFGEMAVLL
jgi:hypothetical protein